MKKLISTLLALTLLLTAAPLALAASPTGATPDETAVYTAPGSAHAGLPAHAEATLGKPKAAAFMADRHAKAQTSVADVAAIVAEMIKAGVSWDVIDEFLASVGLTKELAIEWYTHIDDWIESKAKELHFLVDHYILAPDGTLYCIQGGQTVEWVTDGQSNYTSVDDFFSKGHPALSVVDPKNPPAPNPPTP